MPDETNNAGTGDTETKANTDTTTTQTTSAQAGGAGDQTAQGDTTQTSTQADSTGTGDVKSSKATEAGQQTNTSDNTSDNQSAQGMEAYHAMAENSPSLKTAFTVLQERGVNANDMEAIFGQAQRTGDPAAINTKLLADKVGQGTADLIMGNVQQHIDTVKANAEAINKSVYDTVGGEDNWKEVVNWAQQNLPADARKEYADMINAGGTQATLAAKSLMDQAAGDANTTLTSGLLETGTASAEQGGKGMTREEYAKAYQEAHKGGRRPSADELKKLDKQR